MLIITVETRPAKVSFLLDSLLAEAAVGDRSENRLAKAFEGPQQSVWLDLRGVRPAEGEREDSLGRDSRSAVLHLDGTLQTPVDVVLRSRVELLLHGGARRVVLDLSGVSDIDAAGVGELIHIFKTVAAAGGVLEIGRTSPRVRHVLDVAGVLGLLTAGAVR